ncbi:putative fatty acyl-CoA reductase CG5065 [Bombyx mori]|uniref:Fatty acyl-CoA reductase n=1 Tax=Bombyx mori TaxID=7091 RepID=A0A8R1WMW5_BOMMO|nr:putative fatty acyl-CoA reductase CG5065 [Bombyx mori]
MGLSEERDMTHVPTIPEYYKGKSIFITGGSGFIGKIVIEKLLYSCTDLDRIYLLMRPKKSVSPDKRLAQLYSTPCFDRLRKEKPGVFQSKVLVVPGDVMEDGLGLSDEDRKLLAERVNIVFHIAASVRFDDPLKYAVRLNLNGTKEVVELAKSMHNLSSFVHVSTSYSNTNREVIEEVMYPPHADWRDTLEICEKLDEHTLRVMTPKYLGELPNTYTFSKQLAEHAVYEQRGQLPAVIVRPSIVIASADEPISGWIENFNGPVGIFVACGKGIMRTLYTKPDIVSDYIPVDICAKNIIVAAWARGTKPLESSDDVEIYNCCSGELNQINIQDLIEMAKEVGASVPLNDALWTIGGSITTSEKLYYIRVLVQHLLPAIFVDIVLRIFGKKPMLFKIQRRIYIANLALRYYITKQWTFENKNFLALRSKLLEQDKKQFYYLLEGRDKKDYFLKCCIGGRRYLMKERDEDIPKAKLRFQRMMVLDKTVQVIFYGLLLWWSIKIFNYYFGLYCNFFVA